MSAQLDLTTALAALAEVIVPGSPQMPSASDAGIGRSELEAVLVARPDVLSSLNPILSLSHQLETPEALAAALRKTAPDAFAAACFIIEAAYLTDPGVWSALNYRGQIAIPVTDESNAMLWDEITAGARGRRRVYRPTPAGARREGSELVDALRSGTTRILDLDDVRSVGLDVVKTLIDCYAGTWIVPDPVSGEPPIPFAGHGVSAYLRSAHVRGIKWNGVPRSAGLPASRPTSTILLSDGVSGRLLGILDGSWITDARAAATTLLSIRSLVLPRRLNSIAVIGCGLRAAGVLRMLLEDIPTDGRVMLYDPDESNCRYVERQILPTGRESAILDDPRAAIEADVVLLSPSNGRESFTADHFAKDAVICLIELTLPVAAPLLSSAATIVVDDVAGYRGLVEGGGPPTLGVEAVALARLLEEATLGGAGLRVVMPMPDAREDIAVAHSILLEAEEQGLGRMVRV